jgi:hypothetical protein
LYGIYASSLHLFSASVRVVEVFWTTTCNHEI